ncbi:MAG: rhomboid family intramembrane serine protease [Candidatus Aenigmarchaeota archaeon]|nr:rhomboid family intramembrane serine protease [Candidatus Aenigmarchaeota archaeon]
MRYWRHYRQRPSVTQKILIANVIIFLADVFFSISGIDLFPSVPGSAIVDLFALTPTLAIKGFVWQFVTYMFLHANFVHLFVNMFTLLTFAPQIEMEMGSERFLIFYILCGIGSSILHVLLTGITPIPMVGASGAIFGILTAFGLMFPRATVVFMFLFPMPALTAVVVFGLIELLEGIAYPGSSIAHFGHLGGIITAFILIKFFNFGRKRDWIWVWEY